MANLVTLGGDRQTGKTHTLLTIGLAAASNGKTVAYLANLSRSATEALRRYQQLCHPVSIKRVWLAAGEQRVDHIGGGVIHFAPTSRRPDFDLAAIDTLLLDEVDLDRLLPHGYPLKDDVRILCSSSL